MAKDAPSIRALELARARLDDRLAASPDDPRLLVLRGRADERLEGFEDAALYFERAARLFAQEGDKAAQAGALVEAGAALARAGMLSKGWHTFDRAVTLYQKLGDEVAETRARLLFARAKLGARLPEEARLLLEACLAPLERHQDWEELGWAREQLTLIHRDAGDPNTALEHAREAVKCASKSGERQKYGQRLAMVAALHKQAGNLRKARQYQEGAQPYLVEFGDTVGVLSGYEILVDAALLGDRDEARRLLTEAVDYADRVGRPGFQGRLRTRWARLELDGGDPVLALELLEKAVTLLHAAGDPRASAPAFMLRGRAQWRLGRSEEALKSLERAESFHRMLGEDAAAENIAHMRREAELGEWTP
jgi:tetratricopeptide (TPR) repeat protein